MPRLCWNKAIFIISILLPALCAQPIRLYPEVATSTGCQGTSEPEGQELCPQNLAGSGEESHDVTAQAGSGEESHDVTAQAGSGEEPHDVTAQAGSGEGSHDVTDQAGSVCRRTRLVTTAAGEASDAQTSYVMTLGCPGDQLAEESIVSKCPTQQDTTHSDDEPPSVIPVTSLTTNVTYYNRYCFRCSGDAGGMVTWAVNVSCWAWVEALQSRSSEREVLQAAKDSQSCVVTLQPPREVVPKQCNVDLRNSAASQYRYNSQAIAGTSGPSVDKDDKLISLVRQPALMSLLLTDVTLEDSGTSPPALSDSDICRGYLLHSLNTTRCAEQQCAAGKRLQATPRDAGKEKTTDAPAACVPLSPASHGFRYSLTLLLSLRMDPDDITAEVTSPGQASTSWCSMEALIEAWVSGHLHRLRTDSYNVSAWVLKDWPVSGSAHRNQDPTWSAEVTASSDISGDLYFFDSIFSETSEQIKISLTETDALSESDMLDHDNNCTVNTETGENVALGQVVVWLDFVVTSVADSSDIERAALRMSQREWSGQCGKTKSRLCPRLQTRHHSTAPEGPPTFSFTETSEAHAGLIQLNGQGLHNAVAISPLLLCPYLTFQGEEFSLERSSSTFIGEELVTLTLLNVTAFVSPTDVDASDEDPQNKTLKICYQTFQQRFPELATTKIPTIHLQADVFANLYLRLWKTVERYASLVCVSVSLACLFMVLVAIGATRRRRTILGQNTMALCLNLFLAQALLEFGVNFASWGLACVMAGMLSHYFWLSAILWTNVCFFRLHSASSRPGARILPSRQTGYCGQRIAAYVLYAHVLPLAAVGGTASVTIFTSRDSRVGYGGTVCFLKSHFFVGVAFAAPLALILLLNLLFFVRAVARGEVTSSLQRNCLRDEADASCSNEGPTSLKRRSLTPDYSTGSFSTSASSNSDNSTYLDAGSACEDSQVDTAAECTLNASSKGRNRKKICRANGSHDAKSWSYTDSKDRYAVNMARGGQDHSVIKEKRNKEITLPNKERKPEIRPLEKTVTNSQNHQNNSLTTNGKDGRSTQSQNLDHKTSDPISRQAAKRPGASRDREPPVVTRPRPALWRRQLHAAMRVSSVMGVFWTLRLLAELLDLRLLWLFSVIANGAQGVLMAVIHLPPRHLTRLRDKVISPF